MTEIDKFIIRRVREIRLRLDISQQELYLWLGKGVGIIGDIEAPSKKAKYNTSHLKEIAKVFKCSPKDFWPEEPL